MEFVKTLPIKKTDKITEHFTYGEVIKSANAVKLGIDNSIKSQSLLDSAINTAKMMELVRGLFVGKFVAVSSWYRCLILNGNTSGSSTKSQHPKAEAVDFTIPGVKLITAFLTILASGLKFDQLIFEYGQWLHISFARNEKDNRRMVLVCRMVNGSKEYKTYTKLSQLEELVC